MKLVGYTNCERLLYILRCRNQENRRTIKMEDDNNFRIIHIEKDVMELKSNDKEISKNISDIEKSNIRTERNVAIILETYEIVKKAAIGLLVANIIGILWTMWVKK